MKARYHDSIDTCPILIFFQITGGKKTFDALCYEGKPTTAKAAECWDKIYAEFIEEFGVSSEYKHYTRERALLCDFLKRLHVDGEKWLQTMILIKQAEIRALEMQMAQAPDDFNTLIGKLSKSMGFGIDPMRTTIRQFYGYTKAL